jgi:predicted nucleotidyltransferase
MKTSKLRKKELLMELNRILKIVKKVYQPKQVVLFGSLCNNRVTETSDIDLLIVKNVKKRYLDRIDDFMNLVNPKVAIDVFIFTPQELKNPKLYIDEIFKNGEVIYERKS